MNRSLCSVVTIVLVVSMLWAGQATAQAAACFVTAASYTPLIEAFKRAQTEQASNDDYQHAFKGMGYAQGVMDSEFVNLCTAGNITIGDLMTIIDRHWKTTMDSFDAIPSQTCADTVISLILFKRFPCSPDTKLDTGRNAK